MNKAEWAGLFSVLIAILLFTSFRGKLYHRACQITTANTLTKLDYLTNKNVLNTLGKSDTFCENYNGYSYKIYYDYKGYDDSLTDDYLYFTEELSMNKSFLQIEKLNNINLDEKKELIQYLVIKDNELYVNDGELFISRDNIFHKENHIKDFYNHMFMIKKGLNYLAFKIICYDNNTKNQEPLADKTVPNKGDGYRLWNLQFLRDKEDLVVNNIKDETLELTYKDGSTYILNKKDNKIFSDRQPYRLRVNHHKPQGYKYRIRQIVFLNRRKLVDRFIDKTYPLNYKSTVDLSQAPEGIIESTGR